MKFINFAESEKQFVEVEVLDNFVSKPLAKMKLQLKFGSITSDGGSSLARRYPFITFWLECVATTLKSHVKKRSGYAF